MGRRTLLLVAALVVASLGTLLVFAYVRSADERALEDQDPVQVLVAKNLIKAGTKGSDAESAGSFQLREIPRSAVIGGALSGTGPITNLVAITDIFPGEQIITAKFAQSGESSILPIPTGKIAISVQLGDPQRVAGFVQPGSDVVIFVGGRVIEGAIPGVARENDEFVSVLLPSIQVLAIGPTTLRTTATGTAGNKESLPTAIITLAVSQEEAEKILFAQSKGSLYFGLRNDDSKVTLNTPTGPGNIFD